VFAKSEHSSTELTNDGCIQCMLLDAGANFMTRAWSKVLPAVPVCVARECTQALRKCIAKADQQAYAPERFLAGLRPIRDAAYKQQI
jgi:hypothetical protein